jgi:hypothetical protein
LLRPYKLFTLRSKKSRGKLLRLSECPERKEIRGFNGKEGRLPDLSMRENIFTPRLRSADSKTRRTLRLLRSKLCKSISVRLPKLEIISAMKMGTKW